VGVNFGTATPSDFRLGSNAVSNLYLGSTQVWPVAASLKLTISRNNGSGNTSSFSGIGTLADKYTRAAGYYYDDVQGMVHYTFTLTTSGTVYMTCTCADENDSGQTFAFKKNGTAFATSQGGGSNGFSGSVTGVAGDVFAIVPNANSGAWSSQWIDTVSVYAT